MSLFRRWFKGNQKTDTSTDGVKMSNGATIIDLSKSSTSEYDESKALRIEAVYSCLRDKSETLGRIPLNLYEYDVKGNRKRVTGGRELRLMTQQPNDYMTMQEFLEFLTMSYDRYGAFYAYIVRNDRGKPAGLIPFRYQGNIHPSMDVNGNVYYVYTRNDGKPGDPFRLEDLFIIKNMTTDGFTPLSPIKQTANNLGVAYAQEQSYLEMQTNGVTASMALATDAVFKDDNAYNRLKNDWDKYKGPQGRGQVPILENGVKPVNLKLTPVETELLKHSEFTITRICRTFGVPLHRVGFGSDKAQDVFDLDEAYFCNHIDPIMLKIEAALNKLTATNTRVEFNRYAFYKGSPWRLAEKVDKAVKGGLLSINEGREILGLEPILGGDVFAIDNNNVVYGTWDNLEAVKEQLYGPKPSNSGVNNNAN